MGKNKYSITFACYNAVAYTKMCIDSMIKNGTSLDRLIVVDNGSTDDTRNYLSSLTLGRLILNAQNLGCGVAWNQGALEQQAEWTIIMNNDVIVSKKWVENLISAAEINNLKIISPSFIEGPLDYDFDSFSAMASNKMRDSLRINNASAVCLAVHESVWMEIGYFQAMPKLWGYEDTIFFNAARKAGIQMGTTGASWLHHFGSITQSEMKRERGLQEKQGLGGRHNYLYLNQSWLSRKLQKIIKVKNLRLWKSHELEKYGMTMHGIRENGEFKWF
jgi:N-acetylglucosaminyl-diphospho-decaprenol L-rhamnosyltransferase